MLTNILDFIILHWYEHFTGTDGISVAAHFNIPHSEVLKIMDELEKQQKGKVKRDVELYPLKFNINNNTIEFEKTITSIFFPSQEVLTDYFYTKEYSKQNIPIYKARLYKGSSQIQFFYFDNEVLQRYTERPEYFDIENKITGGHIQFNPLYLKTLSKEEQDDITFPLLRFGKKKLTNNSVAIVVILIDLSLLPEKEQYYWYKYELENPIFSLEDNDFSFFFRQNFLGQFLDDEDPLKNISVEINRIKNLSGGKGLFTFQENEYLHYPVINSLKSFCDSCSELYKLVGPDNLNDEVLICLLKEQFSFSDEDLIDKKSKRPFGKLELFGKLCKNMHCDELYEQIKEIKHFRVMADHKIIDPSVSDENYIDAFRKIIDKLSNNLDKFAHKLEELKR